MQADLIRQIANDVTAELPDCAEVVERFVLDWRRRYGGMRCYVAKKEFAQPLAAQDRPRSDATQPSEGCPL